MLTHLCLRQHWSNVHNHDQMNQIQIYKWHDQHDQARMPLVHSSNNDPIWFRCFTKGGSFWGISTKYIPYFAQTASYCIKYGVCLRISEEIDSIIAASHWNVPANFELLVMNYSGVMLQAWSEALARKTHQRKTNHLTKSTREKKIILKTNILVELQITDSLH